MIYQIALRLSRACLVACAFCSVAIGANSQASEHVSLPAPPKEVVPPWDADSTVCINCAGAPFDPSHHEQFYVSWSEADLEYVKALKWAVWNQDSIHQFESKAHFDNCDFDGGLSYINTLLSEVELHSSSITSAEPDAGAVRVAKLKAYFALGQALHAIQDFYAHTNFVEMMVERHKQKPLGLDAFVRLSIPLWSSDSPAKVKQLISEGLKSGHVWWGTPQLCPAGSPTHGQMAKDHDEKYGGTKTAMGMTLHKLSYELAREATRAFIAYAWFAWPNLQLGPPGKKVLLSLPVGVDRRDLSFPQTK